MWMAQERTPRLKARICSCHSCLPPALLLHAGVRGGSPTLVPCDCPEPPPAPGADATSPQAACPASASWTPILARVTCAGAPAPQSGGPGVRPAASSPAQKGWLLVRNCSSPHTPKAAAPHSCSLRSVRSGTLAPPSGQLFKKRTSMGERPGLPPRKPPPLSAAEGGTGQMP